MTTTMLAARRIGRQTTRLEAPPSIGTWASVAGEMEAAGPLADGFDQSYSMTEVATLGPTFEQAEAGLLKEAITRAVGKAGRSPGDVDRLFAGDLLDQLVTTSFTALALDMPLLGVYGACSTSAESILLAATFVACGACDLAMAATASHHLAAERQYRYPIEAGVQRTPTAQWTATGAAAFLVSREGPGPFVSAFTTGIPTTKGVTDVNNMGAAMAPAAADTIATHLGAVGASPEDYDVILTGDLGIVGHQLCRELLEERGVRLDPDRFKDSGLLLYDRHRQDVHAGGSGAACSALGLAAYLLPLMAGGEVHRALLVATGSLHSPTTSQQGLVIPGIAHAVEFIEGAGR